MEILVPILAAAVRSGTPVLYATLGEILTERAGIMNLGLEGVMLVGAYAGFSVTKSTGNPWLGLLAAALAGALLVTVHAFACIHLGANQVVSGLALTLCGTGLSSLLGRASIGETIRGLGPLPLPGLSQIPFLGPVFFRHDPLVYVSYLLTAFLCWFLFSTRSGLNLRAVGENPRAADAMGLPVARIRYLYTLLGGALAGLGGAYLSVVYTQMWVEGMTAGRGWIALALVIFGIWHPLRAALGSYLFGGVEALQLRIQAAGSSVPAPLLLMLPYLLTILVLLFISLRKGKGILLGAPAALGVPYRREERE
ncbi:nucleoside ABC transporter membrane protein [Aminomonas paucivorans DSM 12260]|uniref:Nucleoside ABC transporter membrane protein n=1 Tax=Aminomonas paucivorans DSM 12260 TaxID=584708 RepID=E3D010_9BACT|nr:ABC transporter permease [Aminomonas paucivorans]EFQ22942.1 nucleoside ABC transporter membrane protein [Aminomonas paucivorans DSM 12260]